MKEKLQFIAVLALLLSGCKKQLNHMETPSSERYIGVASMEKDGTLILQLRAELEGDTILGEGYFRYLPTDPEYQAILKHIGGLQPGESTDVPPWPDATGEQNTSALAQ